MAEYEIPKNTSSATPLSAAGVTTSVADIPPPTARDIRAYRTMSYDHVCEMLNRITGRVKTLIDATIPNEAQARALKTQAAQNVWADADRVERYSIEMHEAETSGQWRPPFPFGPNRADGTSE